MSDRLVADNLIDYIKAVYRDQKGSISSINSYMDYDLHINPDTRWEIISIIANSCCPYDIDYKKIKELITGNKNSKKDKK